MLGSWNTAKKDEWPGTRMTTLHSQVKPQWDSETGEDTKLHSSSFPRPKRAGQITQRDKPWVCTHRQQSSPKPDSYTFGHAEPTQLGPLPPGWLLCTGWLIRQHRLGRPWQRNLRSGEPWPIPQTSMFFFPQRNKKYPTQSHSPKELEWRKEEGKEGASWCCYTFSWENPNIPYE